MSAAHTPVVFAIGSASTVSRVNTSRAATFCVSTTGASPVTVTVSWSAPTSSVPLTVAVNAEVRTMPSRTNDRKPCSVKVTR